MKEHIYTAIDLKSFYASVECRERGLDPMTARLVVADASRTSKTICLAVSPALKEKGIGGRARLFEVEQKARAMHFDYITAVPRMALYMEYSTRIYSIYLRYAAPEDIHVYSIDEVFIDLTSYLKASGMTPYEMTRKIIGDILQETGITATAGIAPNMYLCKVAMDIVAKHIPADEEGVRIATLDEASYRRQLWAHKPLTDFWRVGRGYTNKLAHVGIFTMGDVARCAVENEPLLYKLFGKNAELLIDHAFGYEPTTIADIKAYKPQSHSIGSGQVLMSPYTKEKGEIILREMAGELALDLMKKGYLTDEIVLQVGYDADNVSDEQRMRTFTGGVSTDWYGRVIPKPAHGSCRLGKKTDAASLIVEAALKIYEAKVDPNMLVRRFAIAAVNTVRKEQEESGHWEQLDLFAAMKTEEEKKQDAEKEKKTLKERKAQEAMLAIRERFGKSAILKGTDLEEGATGRDRHKQIGGHKA